MKKMLQLVLLLSFLSTPVFAQNAYRAADLSLQIVGDPLSSLTYETKLVTYTENIPTT